MRHCMDGGVRLKPTKAEEISDRVLAKIERGHTDQKHPVVVIGEACNYTVQFAEKLVDYGVNVLHCYVRKGNISSQFITSVEDQVQLQRLIAHSVGVLAISAFYNEKFTSSFIQQMRGRLWNVHGGSLPEFAGPKPVYEMLKRGLRYGDVTLHVVSDQIDQGPVLGYRRFSLYYPGKPRIGAPSANLVQKNIEEIVIPAAAYLCSDAIPAVMHHDAVDQRYLRSGTTFLAAREAGFIRR